MKAFVIKLESLFIFDNGIPENNFSAEKKKLVIPLYQREYKWTNEKIENLILDIDNRAKFIGNIILDELSDRYEIVDGQQRITTLYLALIYLYNHYSGSVIEQESIYQIIKPYNNSFSLKNSTVGDYISEINDEMSLSIAEEGDVYYQKDDFNRAYNKIAETIGTFRGVNEVRDFKRKLLDCELLILINDQHTNSSPVEQIFLDINEKAQLLEVEDIFKGHCFEQCAESYREILKSLWVNLKRQGIGFTNYFGYSDLSEYLYNYLLEEVGTDISQKLMLNGRHYLEGKTIDEIVKLINAMIIYGQSILNLYSNLKHSDYVFEDLCTNSSEYKNTNEHVYLKIMLLELLEYKNAQYQKIPLFVFINALSTNQQIKGNITHGDFKKVITNLYVYASLFTFGNSRKSKAVLDYTMHQCVVTESLDISSIINTAKKLRINAVSDFSLPRNSSFAFLLFLYSIIDFYDANKNWIGKKYTSNAGVQEYTLEHFIIPDRRDRKIKWVSDMGNCEILLDIGIIRQFKRSHTNFLILNKTLNGNIENHDIVTKIQKIKDWFMASHHSIPNHIQFFIDGIESMQEYQTLKEMKLTVHTPVEVVKSYMNFINAYFVDEHQEKMKILIQDTFKGSFQN